MKKLNIEYQGGTFRRLLDLKVGQKARVILYSNGKKIIKTYEVIHEIKI